MGLQAKVWTALESTCFGEQVLSFFYNLSPGVDPECGQISAIINPLPLAYRGFCDLVPGFHTTEQDRCGMSCGILRSERKASRFCQPTPIRWTIGVG